MPATSPNIRVVDEDEGLGCLEHDVNDLANMAYLVSSAIEGAIGANPMPGTKDQYLIPSDQAEAVQFSGYRLKRMIDDFRERYYRVLEGRKAVQP
ncbi:MAG: hypothetical protein ABSA90_04210 [Xanthobacteraceae bacterium]|jgi:hypothetical protein